MITEDDAWDKITEQLLATIHDVWVGKYSRMVSAPIYFEVAKELIDEVCELLKPKYFHLEWVANIRIF